MSTDTAGFATTLDSAMRAHGWSPGRLADVVGGLGYSLSAPTLRAWATGRSAPRRRSSLSAIAALEEVFGMPDGELSSTLPPHLEVVPDEGTCRRMRAQYEAVRSAWDLDSAGTGAPLQVKARLDVRDPARPVLHQWTAVTATDSPIERIASVIDIGTFLDPGADLDEERERILASMTTVSGTQARHHTLDPYRIAVEIGLEGSLAPGSTALVGHTIALAAGNGSELGTHGRFSCCAGMPVATLVTQVQLPVAQRSRQVRTWTRTSDGVTSTGIDGIRPGYSTGLQAVAVDAPAVAAVVRWDTPSNSVSAASADPAGSEG